MVKKKQKSKIQKRDLIIFILALAVLFNFLLVYELIKVNESNIRVEGEAWLNHQVEINKLKACIDEKTSPCDISPFIKE